MQSCHPTHQIISTAPTKGLARPGRWLAPWVGFIFLFAPSIALAADEINGADTAWILISTALVLFMTIPGLALFYGGLVHQKLLLIREI